MEFGGHIGKILSVSLTLILVSIASGQARSGAPAIPPTAKATSLIDITGYWVSIVTEDWRFRMVTPPKGDYTGLSLTPEGRAAADAWDPAKDESAGEQCRSYGAPNLLHLPGRLHITWQNDQTLRIEADAGKQIRTLYFGAPEGQGGGWQGVSKASWEAVGGGRGQKPVGSLKVVTTNLKPGYLRKNGVPYSAGAVVTEYFDRVTESDGDAYLMVTTSVEDPIYLAQPFLSAAHYKKQADTSGWNPTACAAR